MKCISLSKQSLCWLHTHLLQNNYVKILSFVQQQQVQSSPLLTVLIIALFFKTQTMTICKETRKLFTL